MEKGGIKEIETKQPDELWHNLNYKDSEENIESAFKQARGKLDYHPDLYYLDLGDNGKVAMVRKRVSDDLVYAIDKPSEVELLRQVGIKK